WILQMDATVGAVNDALARTGADADTLVLFASDNGSPGRNGSAEAPGSVVETFGHNPNGVLRGMKGDAWEGGHRVPLLAKWPGRIRAGARSDRLVCLMDLFATCADLLGAEAPAGAAEDSVSLLPLLTGAADEAVRSALVHHSFHGLFAMRQDAWKYIPGPGSGGFSAFGGPRQDVPPTGLFDTPEQLYDLADDLREQHNLWGDRQAIVAGLAHALATCRFGPGA
ncbi:MAG: sulfatase-like hydrolase/transferase, partial [Planctomycetota bacterium]